jgi:hypothetical protein
MNSFHGGDASTGTLTSPPFTVTHRFLNFQLAGGATRRTRLELQFDGRVVHEACGQGDGVLRWASWDVSALLGRQAVLRAVDEATETGGYLLLDHIVMTDEPVHPPSVTDITLWADHGRDFYAPICFGNVPDGRVLWMGWMSNWDYARQLPSKPWRGQMSGVRELDLVEAHDGLRLRQRVAREMEALLESPALAEATAITAAQAAALLTQSALSSRHLMARLEVLVQGLNSPVGLEVFKSPHEAVRVGFDPQRKTFFVDRRTTSPSFVGQSERHDALRLVNAPRVLIEIWIDGSTIEMFADGGTVVISDLAYPRPEATCVGMFHGPENPMITRLTVHTVRATMHTPAR